MREVFVYYTKGLYHIIDKANPDSIFAKESDVLLFNATYKRLGKTKGWHGILSEEINRDVVKLLNKPFYEIVNMPKLYYPRYKDNHSDVIKKCEFLRLQDGKQFIRNGEYHNKYIEKYTKPWESTEEGEWLDIQGQMPAPVHNFTIGRPMTVRLAENGDWVVE